MQFDFWVVLGFVAQFCFFMRFFVQWISSEKAGRPTIPFSFWIFSLIGGFGLLAYAAHRKDPVFLAGQGLSLLIYLRNMQLHRAAGSKPCP